MPVRRLILQLALLSACDAAIVEPDGGVRRPDGGPPPRDAGVAAIDSGDVDPVDPVDAGTVTREDFAWERASIYLLMVDRFADGTPNAADECFDPSHPRRFHGGDLVGLRQRLDYLQELGVDTVWVTPLTRQIGLYGPEGECGFHGYWASLQAPDDGAIEPRLGTEADLHALIDAMHARGMRLILDMVVNHAGYGAPITSTHPEWFQPREGCEHRGDPEETCPLANLPDFDQSNPDAAQYLAEHGAGWLRRFAFDGVRMDTVKHVPLSFFAERWIPAVRAVRELYVIGEVFDESPYETQRPYLDAGFDGLFDFRLRRALVDDLARGGSLDGAAQRVGEAWRALGPQRARLRGLFVENHDVPRFASEIDAPSEAIAVARHHLALALITTTPGVPQLYAGTELGMTGFWPENRRDMPAWGFEPETRAPHAGYLGDPAATFALTRDLLALRRSLPALHGGDYVELWRPGGSGVPLYAFARRAGESRVIVTLSTGEVRARIPLHVNPHLDVAAFANGTALVDRLERASGARAEIVDGELDLVLPPHAIAIWALE